MSGTYRAWFERVAISCLGYRESLESTYTLAVQAIREDIAGDFVECGVYAGAECAAMAKAIMLTGANRRVHLFDSFQGVPPCGPEDVEFVAAGTKASGASCPMADVQRNMRDWGIPDELLVWHPGWFADTVPDSGIDKIALLRLDGDLYSSTKVCLEHLYPKVPRGGWVCVDDYPLSGCRQALHEVVGYPQPVYFQRLPGVK